MPIEIAGLSRDIITTTRDSFGLAWVFSSVIYTSILLAIIILVVLMFLYPCRQGTPGWALLKIFIYILVACVAVMYVHNSVIKNSHEQKYQDNRITGMLESMDGNDLIYQAEKKQVNPGVLQGRMGGGYLDEQEPHVPLTVDQQLSKIGL